MTDHDTNNPTAAPALPQQCAPPSPQDLQASLVGGFTWVVNDREISAEENARIDRAITAAMDAMAGKIASPSEADGIGRVLGVFYKALMAPPPPPPEDEHPQMTLAEIPEKP